MGIVIETEKTRTIHGDGYKILKLSALGINDLPSDYLRNDISFYMANYQKEINQAHPLSKVFIMTKNGEIFLKEGEIITSATFDDILTFIKEAKNRLDHILKENFKPDWNIGEKLTFTI